MEDTRHENRSWRHGSRLQACLPRGYLLVLLNSLSRDIGKALFVERFLGTVAEYIPAVDGMEPTD